MMRGYFITFEGVEGSGKSLQIRLLAKNLQAHGIDVVQSREPGGTPAGETLRDILLHGTWWSAEAESLLNYAARDYHLRHKILPSLERGAWVLCDRFLDSTYAYQGHGGQGNLPLIKALERYIVGENMPDLTLILDVPPEIGLSRAGAVSIQDGLFGESDRTKHAKPGTILGDSFEKRSIDYHKRVRTGFLKRLSDHSRRCVLIDGSRSKESVEKEIWKIVAERFIKVQAP